MYFWKCWRDSRMRFMAMAAIVVTVGMLSAWAGAINWQVFPPGAVGAISAKSIDDRWRDSMIWMAGIGNFLLWVSGIWLGAGGVGLELQTGSASFALTRPHHRRHFVWASLALGAVELFALVCLLALSTFLALAYSTSHVGTWRVFALASTLFVTGILWFGFTQLLTVLLRSTRNAINGAVVATIVGRLAYNAVFLRGVYNAVFLRVPSDRLGDMDSQLIGHVSILANLAWVGLALAFVLLGQLVLERAEV
jgi:hypothetical protein